MGTGLGGWGRIGFGKGLGTGAAGIGCGYMVVTGVDGIGPLGKGHTGKGVEGMGRETETGG